MSGHTPGPSKVGLSPGPWRSCWDAAPDPDEFAGREWGVLDADGDVVVGAGWYDGPLVLMNEANGRLIAAAPDLLDALAAITDGLDWEYLIDGDKVRERWMRHFQLYQAAMAAIAKAKGETL